MQITVFYDGDCPLCVREVARWKHASFSCDVEWFDIAGQDEELQRRGIDPALALLELHTMTDDGEVFTSIGSYGLLLCQLPGWRWLGKLMLLPVIRPTLKWIYDWLTKMRLKREGRWPACEQGTCAPDKRNKEL